MTIDRDAVEEIFGLGGKLCKIKGHCHPFYNFAAGGSLTCQKVQWKIFRLQYQNLHPPLL